jgi:hypothetical protein
MAIQNGNKGRRQPISVELVRLIPQVLWIVLAAAAIVLSYPVLANLVESGGISKFAIGTLIQIELNNVPLKTAQGTSDISIAKQSLIPDPERK